MTRINNINGPSFNPSEPPISGREATMPPRKLEYPTDTNVSKQGVTVLSSMTHVPMNGVGPRVLGEALQQGIHDALDG